MPCGGDAWAASKEKSERSALACLCQGQGDFFNKGVQMCFGRLCVRDLDTCVCLHVQLVRRALIRL